MKIYKVLPRMVQSNSYILTADGKTAVVIDPNYDSESELRKRNLECKAVLLTHGHFDHICDCGFLYKAGVRIYCGEKEKDLIHSPEYKNIFHGCIYVPDFEVYDTFKDGDKIELCGMEFTVMHTPGHSAGSVCYICGNCIFTGDTLFFKSIGWYDFPTGNKAELIESVKKLYALDGDYKLYCGHGKNSTLDYERRNNPFVRG